MADFSFDVGFYAFDQFDITGLNQTNLTNTAGSLRGATVSYSNNATFTLDDNPSTTTITINDDDGPNAAANQFADGAADLNNQGNQVNNSNQNNQFLSADITINGESFSAGDRVELEFAFNMVGSDGSTLEFWTIRIDGINIGLSGPIFAQPGVTYTSDGGAVDLTSIPIDEVPCFTPGSFVETPSGPCLVETLEAGDLVLTKDHEARSVRWVGSRKVSFNELRITPSLRPIMIEAGAMGPKQPSRDMVVSQEHRMLIANNQVSVLFGVSDALVAARSMVNGDTIRIVQPEDGVEYIHVMFDKHEIIFVDGTETESFFPGELTVGNLEEGPRAELLGLFPELGPKGKSIAKLARRSLKKAEAELVL